MQCIALSFGWRTDSFFYSLFLQTSEFVRLQYLNMVDVLDFIFSHKKQMTDYGDQLS